MLQALLHGKLSREQENMEDILTSNVFGLLSYLPPAQGLLPFFGEARMADGNRPLAELPSAEAAPRIDYLFWPQWRAEGCNFCEPDVVVTIRPDHAQPIMILVEAKYRSGKSSEADATAQDGKPPWDQLAREWDNLVRKADRANASAVLIYLTADPGFPYNAVRASLEEFRKARSLAPPPRICWLSWRHLFNVAAGASGTMLGDLHDMLGRLGLHFFSGVSELPRLAGSEWTFRAVAPSPRTVVFSWDDHAPLCIYTWEFGHA